MNGGCFTTPDLPVNIILGISLFFIILLILIAIILSRIRSYAFVGLYFSLNGSLFIRN